MKNIYEEIGDLTNSTQYHHFDESNSVVCMIQLKNGYEAIGITRCRTDVDFDLDVAYKISHRKAIEKIIRFNGHKQ